MPPWHIDKTVGIQEFKNDLSLRDEQVETIVKWVDSGAPRRNPADMPPAVRWPEGEDWMFAVALVFVVLAGSSGLPWVDALVIGAAWSLGAFFGASCQLPSRTRGTPD